MSWEAAEIPFALAGQFLEELRKINIVERARGYDKELLLIHGEMDEKVPVAAVGPYLDMYGDRVQVEIIKGSNHQFSSLDWKQQVYDKTVEYMKKRL